MDAVKGTLGRLERGEGNTLQTSEQMSTLHLLNIYTWHRGGKCCYLFGSSAGSLPVLLAESCSKENAE